MELKIPKIQK